MADGGESGEQIRTLLIRFALQRGLTKTFCPSEVARSIGTTEAQWRALMDPVRGAARQMIEAGDMQCLQKGVVVDIDDVRGPIRLRATQQLLDSQAG